MDSNILDVKNSNADATALGLLGLAMVTLVASSEKLGLTQGVSFLIPWAFFLGASAQLFACISDYKRGNVFGTTSFGGYAFFWFAVGVSWLIKLGVFGETAITDIDSKQLGFAFFGYLIFTLYMTIGAITINKTLVIILFLIDILYLGLTLNAFGIIPDHSYKIAGISEFLISILAFYASAASVLNVQFQKELLPLGKPLKVINVSFKNEVSTKNV